jgi:hypothetical protein
MPGQAQTYDQGETQSLLGASGAADYHAIVALWTRLPQRPRRIDDIDAGPPRPQVFSNNLREGA